MGGKASILVMDADAKVRQCLMQILSFGNCEAREARDIAEAKTILAEEGGFAALLLGQRVEDLSDSNRYEAPPELRHFLGQLPVLVVPLIEIEHGFSGGGPMRVSPYCRLNTISNLLLMLQSLRKKNKGELTRVTGN